MTTTESNIYVPTQSVQIQVRRIEALPVDYEGSSQITYSNNAFRVVTAINHTSQGEPPELTQTTELHRRDFRLRRLPDMPVVWVDQYGNFYSGELNVKSNNGTYPIVYKQEAENNVSERYFIYGYQETAAALRSVMVSNALRKAGVDTDYIIEAVQPLSLPYEGKQISLSEMKRILLENLWSLNAQKGQIDPKTGNILPTRADLSEVAEYLADDNMTFVIYVRAQQVQERFLDFSFANTKEDFYRLLDNVFAYINAEEKLKAEKDATYTPRLFNTRSPVDLIEYFVDYFPKRLAKNCAIMHNLMIVHHMLHGGNYSAIGGIHDTESPRGEILDVGDKPVTATEYMGDINSIFEGIQGYGGIKYVISSLHNKGFLSKTITADMIINVFNREYTRVHAEILTKQIRERKSKIHIMEDIVSIYESFDCFAPTVPEYLEIIDEIRAMLAPYADLPEAEVDIEELVEDFFWTYEHDLQSKIHERIDGSKKVELVVEEALRPEGEFPENAADKFFTFAKLELTCKYMDSIKALLSKLEKKYDEVTVLAVVNIAMAKATAKLYTFAYGEPYNALQALEKELDVIHTKIRERHAEPQS